MKGLILHFCICFMALACHPVWCNSHFHSSNAMQCKICFLKKICFLNCTYMGPGCLHHTWTHKDFSSWSTCEEFPMYKGTIGGISKLFHYLRMPLGDNWQMIPANLWHQIIDEVQDLLVLPLWHGGLGIQNSVQTADREDNCAVSQTHLPPRPYMSKLDSWQWRRKQNSKLRKRIGSLLQK